MSRRPRAVQLGVAGAALLALAAGLAAQGTPPAPQIESPSPQAEGAPAQTESAPTTAEARGAPPAPQYSRKGADSCLACHDEPHILSIFRTKHARRADDRTPFGHGQLQCEACHGPGGAHAGRVRTGQERPAIPVFGSASPASVAGQNGMCLGCHAGKLLHGWPGSAHERENLACVNCHDSHPKQDPMLHELTQVETCVGCHATQRAQSLLPYSHPVRQDRMTCAACHEPHGTMTDAALRGRTLNETCFGCHADKRGPFLWEHAPVVEDCSLCHEPHGSAHPALLTRRQPLLCQQCHSEAGHPSVPLNPGQLPGGAPSAQVLGRACQNCHTQVHGSNHPSGAGLMR